MNGQLSVGFCVILHDLCDSCSDFVFKISLLSVHHFVLELLSVCQNRSLLSNLRLLYPQKVYSKFLKLARETSIYRHV